MNERLFQGLVIRGAAQDATAVRAEGYPLSGERPELFQGEPRPVLAEDSHAICERLRRNRRFHDWLLRASRFLLPEQTTFYSSSGEKRSDWSTRFIFNERKIGRLALRLTVFRRPHGGGRPRTVWPSRSAPSLPRAAWDRSNAAIPGQRVR